MEQITITLNNMNDVKREIDACQRKAMTSVVELGYILRKAADAELYRQEGYSSIFKFAESEYGWDQSQTSRFMDINREFSEGGYSTVLKPQYEGYGQAKLAEMLTIPETIREELSPDMKRDDIRALKKDLKLAEEKDKEDSFAAAVMLEPTTNEPLYDSIETLFLLPDMGKKLPALYHFMRRIAKGEEISNEDIRVTISATGFGMVRAGKVMYFWKKDGFNIVRGVEKTAYDYKDLIEALISIRNPIDETPEEWYRKVYAREIPGAEKKEINVPEVAPAHETSLSGEEQSAEKPTQREEREELEGQSEIKDFAEEMSITYEKDKEEETKVPEVAPAQDRVETEKVTTNAENSTKREDLATDEPKTLNNGGCPYCGGTQDICSNDGMFRIHLSGRGNGLGRIERGIYNAVIEFNYCPECGRKLDGKGENIAARNSLESLAKVL